MEEMVGIQAARACTHLLRFDNVNAAAVRATVAHESRKLHHLEPQAHGLEDGAAVARCVSTADSPALPFGDFRIRPTDWASWAAYPYTPRNPHPPLRRMVGVQIRPLLVPMV